MSHDHNHLHDHHHPDTEDGWVPPTESVTLSSVGIDIGSATSQVVFSTLVLERQGRHLSSRFVVVDRMVEAASEIWFTPFLCAETIDAQAVAARVALAYEAAGLKPGDIDSGAVIITGEAARKSNAERIVAALAEHAGDFVCATAGHTLEGVLAAHGSGTVTHTEGAVLNADIGGGTAKLTLVEDGVVQHVHAVNVGGRLVAWDDDGTVTRLEAAGRRLGRAAGVELEIGRRVEPEQIAAIGRLGAQVILAAMAPWTASAETELSRDLALTPALPSHDARTVVFSGGVGRLVAEGTEDGFGDLGAAIARGLRDNLAAAEWSQLPARETLRATVIGAGQFTVQLSGSTIDVSADADALTNVPVVPVPALAGYDPDKVRSAVADGFVYAGIDPEAGPVAISLHLPHPDSPQQLKALAAALVDSLELPIRAGQPVVVVIDQDLAGLVGHLMRKQAIFTAPLLVLDQVDVDRFDYLDIGRKRADSGVVPVVVKSLVF